ncbi:low affinity iron permease family protein [Pseudomonas sp. JR33AA]|uniref:low affinity iron permease family protein n=1 Tax=Pseudomonas sp. JR33AA TaxID=2899113 RepID=UPI001F2B8EEF|nr:low affinity iron permease family protein [Pseudomonas sp. JR33AA]MCE5976607.1 low affinity iron permease family protein [Pseudomonas sp. JR33AA]
MKFARFCQWLSNHAGRPSTFLIAIVLIAMWGASGPWFHYNDTWQLIINTSTTIITFLMVFLIQNTQNRDNDIIHVKLDELIRATKSAERSVLDLEALDSEQLHTLRKEYRAMGEQCDEKAPFPSGNVDADVPTCSASEDANKVK